MDEYRCGDLARVSPLIREHVHVPYQFTLEESVAQGGMRPLWDSEEIDEYELMFPESGM